MLKVLGQFNGGEQAPALQGHLLPQINGFRPGAGSLVVQAQGPSGPLISGGVGIFQQFDPPLFVPTEEEAAQSRSIRPVARGGGRSKRTSPRLRRARFSIPGAEDRPGIGPFLSLPNWEIH